MDTENKLGMDPCCFSVLPLAVGLSFLVKDVLHQQTGRFSFDRVFFCVLTRFTSVRVSAKYHGMKLEYREHRHTALDLLGQIRNKLQVWKRSYISPEAVRLLLQEWHVSGPAGAAGGAFGACLAFFSLSKSTFEHRCW